MQLWRICPASVGLESYFASTFPDVGNSTARLLSFSISQDFHNPALQDSKLELQLSVVDVLTDALDLLEDRFGGGEFHLFEYDEVAPFSVH